MSTNTIRLSLNSQEYNNYCGEIKPIEDTDIGTFTITHNAENIILKKVKKQSSKD